MYRTNTAQSGRGKRQILNAYTQLLLLKLTFHLAQMNSGRNPLGGWSQRDTLRRNGPQTNVGSDISGTKFQVCAEFLSFLVIRTIRVEWVLKVNL